ncbi:MAG: NAD kinase [Saprospiraceae bacterium]|jgi:NAD+ kinase|nr:NAD kinase [Saprospiraceae bacterium]MBP6567026.1 NAD kinase [Saprospiraceae bacterium]
MKWLIYGHSIKDAAEYEYVNTVISTAVEYDVELCVFRPYLDELIRYNPDVIQLAAVESSSDLITQRPDIMITLGGDGTILQAITLLKDSGIPVLGINLGRLGFLASVEKKIIKKAVKQLINKEYTTVSRSLLGLKCNLPLFDHFPFALNDFTLNKRDTSSMITIHTYIDNVLLNSYWADGIIISTPTGSTGYSLSCGGPIIFPDSQNIVITPVAPHNLNVRPIVIPDTLSISLKVEGRTDSFMCTLDSRYETITSSHRIEINKGNFFINFVQLKGQTFMKTISEKLLWGLDKRN